MVILSYEEQAIIKIYSFSSKEELIKKLQESLNYIDDIDTKKIVKKLIPKIDNYTVDELKNINNIFE